MHAQRRGVYYGWVLVWMLGIIQIVSWGIIYYGFTAFMPSIEGEMGWSRGQLSAALSIAMLVSGLVAAPVGYWIDTRGPRLLMTVGAAASAGLVFALSQVTELWQFYIVWAGIGITMGFILYEPAFAVVTAWFQRDRIRALTIITLMAGLASTIFLPVETWLIGVQGWRSALGTLAVVLAVVTVVPYGLLLRRRPADLGFGLDGDPDADSTVQRRVDLPALPVAIALRLPSF